MKSQFQHKLFTTALVGALAAATAAYADDMTAPSAAATNSPAATPMMAPADEDGWQFGANVPLWAPQVNGTATVLGHQQDVNISFNELKDHLDASFALGLDARKGKYDLFGNVGYMKFSGGFNDKLGGNFSAELKFVVANAGVAYQLVKTEGEHPFLLAGTGGVRYFYVATDMSHRNALGTHDWAGGKSYDVYDPVFGLRASQYITKKLHLDIAGDGGGFNINHDTDWTWSAMGAASYDFTKWLTLSAGYQALALDESEGSGANRKGVNLIFNGAFANISFRW